MKRKTKYVWFHNVEGARFKVKANMKWGDFLEQYRVREVRFDLPGTPLVKPWWRME